MATLKVLFAVLIILISVNKCSNTSPEKICDDDVTREKIISVLISDEVYKKQLLDSLQSKERIKIHHTDLNWGKR